MTTQQILQGVHDWTNGKIVYDISVAHPDGQGKPTPYADLTAALGTGGANIPEPLRKGGMSVKFIQGNAQSSDNKYVQYRLMSDEFTTDTTQWAIADEGVYVENPEFVRVILDNENKILEAIRANGTKLLPSGVEVNDKIDFEGNETTIIENPEFVEVRLDGAGHILWAIKADGGIYYGAGVPQQVIDYINEKIAELSLDEYEDIVAFLDDLEKGDETLQDLLDEKVDKEEGKSLIDEEYASTKSAIESPEFVEVTTDSEDKVLEATEKDGTKLFGGDVKVLGFIDVSGVSCKVVSNPEWLKVVLDSEDRIICGIKPDGKFVVYVADFLDDIEVIKARLEELDAYSITENPEFMEVELDVDDKIIGGRKVDGTKFENNDVELNGNATVGGSLEVDGVVIKNIEDPENRNEITLDSEKKIISYRKDDGTLVENVGFESPKMKTNQLVLTDDGLTELERDLKAHGFTGGQGDWSDSPELYIPEPRFAIVNITNGQGSATMPHAKFVDYKYYMQVWDMNGNYFKKEVIMNGQGNSSILLIKGNFAVDMCNNNGWDDDDTFKLKIGDWVPQDSFHFKAFYNDFVRGSSIIAYKVADKIEKSRGPRVDRPWKKALLDTEAIGTDTTNMVQIDDLTLQFDTDAKCHPDGFPCAVYVEGSFYGLYAWCLKKHRDNYHQDKGVSEQIHLDGDLYTGKFWKLNEIDWTGFEMRNPKELVYLVPRSTDYPITKKGIKGAWGYDADVAQAEIAGVSAPDSDIAAYDATKTYALGEMCKSNKRYFISIVNDNIGNTPTPQKKAKNIWETAATDGHWLDITHTNTVKKYILELCTRMDALAVMSNVSTTNGVITIRTFQGEYKADLNYDKGKFVLDSDTYYMSIHTTNIGNPLSDTNYWQDITSEVAAIKEYFCNYFDKENLIDYQITQMVTGDTDGYGKNWQWVTYDGIKWYVTEYDKDMSFGNHYTGQLLTEPQRGWLSGYLKSHPIGWVVGFYTDEIKERWQWLYQNNIITSAAVIKELTDWCSRIGKDYFDKEYSAVDYDGVKLGKLSPCNREDFVDTENWERTNLRKNDSTFTYDPAHTYQAGDTCWYGKPGQVWSFQFIAKKETTGNPPITQFYNEYPYNLGYRDSIWRFMNYIEETVSLQNDFINSLL